ncbi:MAG: hypothetical protein C4332_10130 [Meiothermus sp.]
MNTFVIAWILLLGFALFNNYAIYRMLSQRSRMDLFWIPVAATVIPVVLFAIWPGAYTLLAFPVLQSFGFWLLFRLLSGPR